MSALVLASQSQTRRTMLAAAGLDFTCVNPGVDEDALKAGLLAEGASPRDIADALAQAKAVKASSRHAGLVIGADSTLEIDGVLIDKAATLAEAKEVLQRLRGGVRKLCSAAVLAENGVPVWRAVETAKLTVRACSDAFIDTYLAKAGESVLSSVGCFHLEGLGAQMFDKVEGDWFTVLGLPLLPLLGALRQRGMVET